MSNIKLGYSNYVQWYLKSEVATSILIPEPINWDANDSLKMKRHDEYHGMLFQYTGDLIFTGEGMDYIEEAYVLGGVNAKCRLTKYVLIEKENDVKWVERYSFLADWKTKEIKDQKLSIKWNTFNLEELIRSHETDEFEVERSDSIDGIALDPLILDKTEITGRNLNLSGQTKLTSQNIFGSRIASEEDQIDGWTPFTEFVSQGAERNSDVQSHDTDPGVVTSASMFYVRETTEVNPTIVDVRWDISCRLGSRSTQPLAGNISIKLLRMQYVGANWTVEETYTIFSGYAENEIITVKEIGQFRFENILYNQGIMIVYEAPQKISCTTQNIWVNEISNADSSPNLSCIFVNDLMERLMYILTGEKDKFYSKYFGRIGVLDKNGFQKYTEDGFAGLMAYITGYWLRGFDPESDKYKSITTSIKKEFKNLKAVYNIGATIEFNKFNERLRFEELGFFYREELVIKFTKQLKNVVRKVDGDLFFSAMTFGYEKTDDYEDDNGLDEPNQQSSFVTPIRASENKFEMLSKTRTDDIAMELTRRKPFKDFPEDTKRDDDNFFLDLKSTEGGGYTQNIWSDRLKVLPEGIFSPETWKGMFFTPMRMKMRHSWIFRAGLEPYLSSKYKVKHISSTGNQKVITHAKDDWRIGLDEPISEEDDVKVSDLERSKFLPELVTAEHVISEELWEWINSTTEVVINGKIEDVPNYYFKMQFINENGNYERGYIMELEPKGKGIITYQVANENLI